MGEGRRERGKEREKRKKGRDMGGRERNIILRGKMGEKEESKFFTPSRRITKA